MIQITPQMRILVALEAVDGRKGIDSLARWCQEKLAADPFSGGLFEWTLDCTPNSRRKSPLSDYPSFSSSDERQAV
jgi:hypothetical protein